jgi:hypothetical protein
MLNKTRYRYRRCRARPPTKGTSREGPGMAQFQFYHTEIEHFPRGPDTIQVKRRWGDPHTAFNDCRLSIADCRCRGADIPQRSTQWFPEPYRFLKYFARDWISNTCSEHPGDQQNRDNNRSGTTATPATGSGVGELCLHGYD